jgi:hypothetical protein
LAVSEAALSLDRRPEARTESIEALVAKARRGLIRVPEFQRGLRWKKAEAVALFDSIFRGYPIGSLFLWEHAAPAARIKLGHLVVDAPEAGNAWSVVDGQQRLTTLAAALTADNQGKRDEAFDLYFDVTNNSFVVPDKQKVGTETLIPVFELLDAASLSELLMRAPHATLTPSQRRAVFEAGKRIREYQVPIYIITTDDKELLREIFHRTNNAGISLKWTEIHDALFAQDGRQPSTIKDVADDIASLGMGRADEEHLLSASLAAVGLDPTRTLDEHIERSRDKVALAAATAMPALRKTFDFLRGQCGVPHIRLLPHWEPVLVLARFFAVHPQPHPRTVELLVRWVWRGPLTGEYKLDPRTLLRRAVAAVQASEHEAVQALLELVPRSRPDQFEVPERFDARTAATRFALLALADLRPRDLEDGAVADVASLLEQYDLDAFSKMIADPNVAGASSPSNRLLHRSRKDVLDLLVRRASADLEDPVLRSHGISAEAAKNLVAGNMEGLLRERTKTIAGAVEAIRSRMASWNRGDRPPVEVLLARGEMAK